jgi:hypothetical protein
MIKKLDQKFYGDVYKAKDGSDVPDNQWVVFLAKDDAFALTMPTYLENCKKLGCDAEQIAAVERLIANIHEVRAGQPGRNKKPDAEGEALIDPTTGDIPI